jgi:poly(3-hydroxybutyrate) depolymerase
LYSAEKTIEQISEINACNGNVNEASLSDINVKDKSTVTRIDFDCSTPIVYYRVNGGGHHWPGATFDANLFYSKPLGPFNQDLDTNEAIWQFCAPFRRE